MTSFSFTYRPDADIAFRPGAFDKQIGTRVTVEFGGFGETGTLLKADVAEDGRSVRFTLEVDDDSAPGLLLREPGPGVTRGGRSAPSQSLTLPPYVTNVRKGRAGPGCAGRPPPSPGR